MTEQLNNRLDQPVMIDLSTQAWTPSPSPQVLRKRLYLDGESEAGRVTSLVIYQPGAQFPAHPHPDGEEIFVLQGVFSDEKGNWPAGTLLLNPQGFEHAPRTRLGCLLLVHLQQYPGKDRPHRAVDSTTLPWQQYEDRLEKPLYRNLTAPRWLLQHWPAGRRLPVYDDMTEILVLSGALGSPDAAWPDHSWMRLPPGYQHGLETLDDTQLLLRMG